MNPEDILRMIDVLHREKDIPKDVLFEGLEVAIATAVKKRLGAGEDLVVAIDRTTGEIKVEDDEGEYEFDLPSSAASPPRPASRPSCRRCARPSATCSTTSTRPASAA
jgi:hypothetical protein